MTALPVASISLDLDNKWSYMKTHGDDGWQQFPSYLDVVVPRALELMRSHGLRMTVFIVGQDAALPQNHEVLRSIARAGHEIGNHSFHHEPWLHLRPVTQIDEELELAENAIEHATGVRPRGFRGPGFVRSAKLYDVLVRRGYVYDGSVLGTFIGPLARAYYFRSAKLSVEERRQRESIFGSFRDALLPNRAHIVRRPLGSLVEVPVTTMPILRVPIHVSYLMYLAAYSPALAIAYFRTALKLCDLTKTAPSTLLHPLDFISEADCPELRFFPAMNVSIEIKKRILDRVCRALASRYRLGRMLDHAAELDCRRQATAALLET